MPPRALSSGADDPRPPAGVVVCHLVVGGDREADEPVVRVTEFSGMVVMCQKAASAAAQ